MIHLGDITKIRGDEISPVDCITGGSPCQDLSVAGKRAGLEGKRSGLFMEQIRIVKEMRERDRRAGRAAWAVRPRFMVWENVPGAFSSNGGKDFQAVLTEIVKIVEPDAPDVPLPDKGKWPKAGCLYSDVGDWSVAWRVHDAQFWGVPQRRKRIALVADFGGLAAPEVLFVREGLSGDPEPRGAEGQGTAAAVESCTGGASGIVTKGNGEAFLTPEKHMSLTIGGGQAGQGYPAVLCAEPILLESNQNHATIQTDGVSTALPASMGMGGGYVPMVTGGAISFQERAGKPGGGKGILIQPERTGALSTLNNQSVLATAYGIDRSDTAGCNGRGWREDQSYTLNTIDRPAVYIPDVAHALSARHDGSPQPDKGNGANIVAVHQNASGEVRENDVAYTIGTNANASGRNTPLVYDARGNGNGETAPTMTGDHQSRVTDYTAVCVDSVQTYSNQAIGQYVENDKASSLKQRDYKDATDLVVCREDEPQLEPYTQTSFAQYERGVGTLRANGGDLGGGSETLATTAQTVRRLTPTECERLQGFPDGWTDIGDWVDSKGKKHKAADSPRYKALGNSIALPFWFWLLRRISAQYERPATLGSLFDGIGGFPLCWERCNGPGTAIWASEIEEFPIAVTKKHFPEEKEDT